MELAPDDSVGLSIEYSPFLGVPRVANLAPDRPCEWCCAWSLPLSAPYRARKLPDNIAMTFQEWLVWHWHVINHQRGVPLS